MVRRVESAPAVSRYRTVPLPMPNPLPPDASPLGQLAAAWQRQPAPLRFLSLWLPSVATLLCALWPVLHDAHYWDAGGCYVAEARLHFLHGANLEAIRAHLQQYLLRPVFYTGLVALVMGFIGESPFVTHTFHLMFCCLLPATLSEITLALGGRVWQAWVAAAITLITPYFIAQIGLVQTDLPLTTLLAISWLFLLKKQRLLFCLFSAFAVWTKESAYFIAAPAAILLWWQADAVGGTAAGRLSRRGLGPLIARLWAAWPALSPLLAMIGWLSIRRYIKGSWLETDHVHALSLISPAAHYHNWLDAGRFGLSLLMLVAIYFAWNASPTAGQPGEEKRRLILVTGLGFLLLPWLFPSYLPRYMLPSLLFAIPLAALGLGFIPSRWRMQVFGALVAIQTLAMTGRLTIKDIAHLESSPAYRRLLGLHVQAAARLAAEHPRQVLAGFPASFFLTAGPEMGYLPRPLRVLVAGPKGTLASWCQADFLIEAQDDSVRPAMQALSARGALTLFDELGPPPRRPDAAFLDKERDETIRLYRIDCRAKMAQAAVNPPAAP